MKKKVVIVGAGIAGLTTGYKLINAGYDVTIVERDDAVGGLSRTYKDKKFAFDSGPHRFYTKNPEVIAFIQDILGENYLSMKMTSSVYILGKYYDWPLSLKVVLKLPFKVMFFAAIDMIRLMFKKPKDVDNYSEYVLQRYGKTLYRIDFDPYTAKFAKIPTNQLHSDWSKAGVNRAVINEKVKMNSIFDVVKNTIFPQKENITIIYPNEGISVFSEVLKKRIEEKGGKIILNTKPTTCEINNKKIIAVNFTDGSKEENVDHVVWTGSINEAAEVLHLPQKELEYLNIITYNVKLKGEPKMKDQWIYYVDDDLIFNRLYNTVRFSPYKAPKGYYGLCVEVTCRDNSDVMKNPESIYDRVLADLKKVRLIDSDKEVVGISHQLLYQAYPIYKINYRTELRKAFDDINNSVENLTLAGRNGLFWYNNMDHSIENAFETAQNIMNGKRHIAINEFWK
ncbi:MAG: FAD-dependent oxidoreductase [Blautia sp.]|nr:FAD-dependent oxidoreductase [Blautia sp.]MCM1200954.1 FAD-dependent oxidoreductase [Bacteroides fragilis]